MRCSINRKTFKIVNVVAIIVILSTSFTLGCMFIGSYKSPKGKEALLRNRIIEYYELSKKVSYSEYGYDFSLPQIRELVGKEYYNKVGLGLPRILDYTIESVVIDNDIAEVIIRKKMVLSNEVIEIKYYSIWGFTHDNWFLADDSYIVPHTDYDKKQYKKLLRDGLTQEVIEDWEKHHKNDYKYR